MNGIVFEGECLRPLGNAGGSSNKKEFPTMEQHVGGQTFKSGGQFFLLNAPFLASAHLRGGPSAPLCTPPSATPPFFFGGGCGLRTSRGKHHRDPHCQVPHDQVPVCFCSTTQGRAMLWCYALFSCRQLLVFLVFGGCRSQSVAVKSVCARPRCLSFFKGDCGTPTMTKHI